MTAATSNTSYKVVIPFYVYAALSFLAATLLLLFSSKAFTQHYFHPSTLAITHIMALGWGTMIILGAAHQLVPVLIEAPLRSNALAVCSFILAATGIPLLGYSFFVFDMGWAAQTGGFLVNCGVLCYLVNLFLSISSSKTENIQSIFIFTATCWLMFTTGLGLLLVCNFTHTVLPSDSLHYLPFHAHIGIAGWFLLLVTGVGSRLIPMFLISKYTSKKLLWWIYLLINGGLVSFIALFLSGYAAPLVLIPVLLVLSALLLFGYYCRQCYRQRIRKRVDNQMKISLLSVMMTSLPLLILLFTGGWSLFASPNNSLVLVYGFTIFFGWLTAIILGMTFKTLPFIIWNKVYHAKAGTGKTPDPKDLFSNSLFTLMAVSYLAGFVLFVSGVLLSAALIMKIAAALLVATALLYNLNVFKVVFHKPAAS